MMKPIEFYAYGYDKEQFLNEINSLYTKLKLSANDLYDVNFPMNAIELINICSESDNVLLENIDDMKKIIINICDKIKYNKEKNKKNKICVNLFDAVELNKLNNMFKKDIKESYKELPESFLDGTINIVHSKMGRIKDPSMQQIAEYRYKFFTNVIKIIDSTNLM